MLATAVDKPFSDKDWLFELKLDGYRAIAVTGPGQLLLYSRNGLSFAQKYPAIAAALKKIKTPAVLDGEIVLLNEDGQPDFQKLQNYNKRGEYQLVYYVFDILSCRQKDLTRQALVERKKILKKILKKSDVVRFCNHIEENGKDFFNTIKAEDLEGMIAKKKDSVYIPGSRTKEWLKIKNHKSQEAIIAGFTEPKGSRIHFGSLILAEYKNRKLKYIGHAGTGFNETTLKELMKKMRPLILRESPFDSPIKVNNKVTWLRPELVCEVGFSELTKDGILRHPVYKGLRPEKTAAAVTQETEQSLPVTAIVPSVKQKK